MFARTTIVRGNPGAVDEAVAYMRDEVMPVVQQMEGCVGLSMLADRDTGRCIIATAWQTEDAMQATMDRVGPMRDRVSQVLGGQPEVHMWEIAVLHRAHQAPDGACTRVTWSRTDPANVDRIVDAYKLSLLPRLEEMDGFCAASLMMDRREGRGAGAVTYADRATMERSRTNADAVREEFAAAMGAQILEVAEFELVLHHLRVPETV
ncbi:antibiotic biosynthesis monooxygenase [Geodermatophilus sp. SYSU D00703]